MSPETLDIILRVVFYLILAVLTYVITPAIKTWRETKLSKEQRETLDYWITVGVRWAKQWMQSATGEEKKEKVMEFVLAKCAELGLPYTQEDIDKAIEAIYESIKAGSSSSVVNNCVVSEEVANGQIP